MIGNKKILIELQSLKRDFVILFWSLFVLSIEDKDVRESYMQRFLPTVETKYYDVLIDGKTFFDQPLKDNLRTYINIRELVTGQRGDYTTGCLLDYPFFKLY